MHCLTEGPVPVLATVEAMKLRSCVERVRSLRFWSFFTRTFLCRARQLHAIAKLASTTSIAPTSRASIAPCVRATASAKAMVIGRPLPVAWSRLGVFSPGARHRLLLEPRLVAADSGSQCAQVWARKSGTLIGRAQPMMTLLNFSPQTSLR
jgi:hypothetical protein|eukprot:COSAG06_NODE_2840_length_6193_cov_5.930095_3_plen_151_part_00